MPSRKLRPNTDGSDGRDADLNWSLATKASISKKPDSIEITKVLKMLMAHNGR